MKVLTFNITTGKTEISKLRLIDRLFLAAAVVDEVIANDRDDQPTIYLTMSDADFAEWEAGAPA